MSKVSLLQSRRARFDALIRPRLHELYSQAYRLTGSREEAEDLVQDLVIKLYENRTRLEDVDNLRPWLYKAMYRQFLNRLRSTSRSPFGYLDGNSEEELDAIEGGEKNPEKITEQHMQLQSLQKGLYKLNPDYQHMIVMHDMEGFTLTEIASMLDAPLGTLKSRLHRARNALRQELSREPLPANRCVKG